MVFGIVGCSQQESNVWVCDSKTFTQDEKQSWADRVTLMRFVFDFNSDISTTARIYAHYMPEQYDGYLQEAMDKLQALQVKNSDL